MRVLGRQGDVSQLRFSRFIFVISLVPRRLPVSVDLLQLPLLQLLALESVNERLLMLLESLDV